MFKQSDKNNHLETAWPSVLFYLIDYNAVMVSCCTSKPTNQIKKKRICMCVYIYIYIHTYIYARTLVMKMALEKGYIFPLKLKINKMVSKHSPSHTL